MVVWFIVTTSIFNDDPIRQEQYTRGITTLQSHIHDMDSRLIVVENNGLRRTFLDDLGCEVYYTQNNLLPTQNKGCKELKDILDCIIQYSIPGSDFIVKMTGRYILQPDSLFMKTIKEREHDCVLRYGSFVDLKFNANDCITGLIGMKCGLIKTIEFPNEIDSVEWKWAKASHVAKTILHLNCLGISICPGGNTYICV